ncbi:MAG: hypothetical protein AB1744_08510 [Candidatus Zixiibacteriota bacterium]
MSYCPQCRYEYEAGVLVCPDCNKPLVDQLDAEETAAVRPDDSWAVVGRVASEMKAEMARGALDSNNIPSVMLSSTFNAYGKGMDFQSGITQSTSEGNVIMVPREYREEALLILEGVLGEDLTELSDGQV